jgi:hypothetical protein
MPAMKKIPAKATIHALRAQGNVEHEACYEQYDAKGEQRG